MVDSSQAVSRTVVSLLAKSLLSDAKADEVKDLQEIAEGNLHNHALWGAQKLSSGAGVPYGTGTRSMVADRPGRMRSLFVPLRDCKGH